MSKTDTNEQMNKDRIRRDAEDLVRGILGAPQMVGKCNVKFPTVDINLKKE